MIKSRSFLLLLIFILLCITGCSEQKELLPLSFEDFILHQKMEGVQAQQLVDKMHFQKVAASKNEIGFYNGPQGKATIYITYYNNVETAQQEEQKMTAKISPQNSVFIQGAYLKFSGKKVYRCFGMEDLIK